MAESDLDVVRNGYAAFAKGDVGALRESFHEDATWVVPGHSPMSGTKQGRDAILAYLGEVQTRTEGTFRITDVAFAEGDGIVFARDRTEASRNGVQLAATGVNVFRVEDGRVRSVQQYFEDTTATDAFWA